MTSPLALLAIGGLVALLATPIAAADVYDTVVNAVDSTVHRACALVPGQSINVPAELLPVDESTRQFAENAGDPREACYDFGLYG